MISKKFIYFVVLILCWGFQKVVSVGEQNDSKTEEDFQIKIDGIRVSVNNQFFSKFRREILALKEEIKTLWIEQKKELSTLREEFKTLLANQKKELSLLKEQTQNSFNAQNQYHAKFEEQLKRIEAAINLMITTTTTTTSTTTPAPTTTTTTPKPIKKAEFDKNFNCVQNCGDIKDLPNDCSEVQNVNENVTAVFVLKPHKEGQLKPFGAYCLNRENQNWTIIQRRFPNQTVSFNRTWDEYKNGFGDLSGDYWLGFDRIHQLTSNAKYKLWLEKRNPNGIKNRNFYYSKFLVADEGNAYKLNVDGWSGDWDFLSLANGWKFSTYDNDNDGVKDENCALQIGVGWWYSDRCFYRNFNSNLYKGDYVHMAIRPA